MLTRPAPAVFVLLTLMFLMDCPAIAQEDDGAFASEERITVLDLSVGIGDSARDAENLDPSDLSVRSEGIELPVVRLDDEEPWDIRIWIDPVTASKQSVRWSADLLTLAAPALADLGTVSVVVAGPDPRRQLAPTRDVGLITAALSSHSLSPEGRDRLRSLRHEALEDGTMDAALAAVADEVDLALSRCDALLTWIADQSSSSGRRLLVLVSEGYDLDPAQFYRDAGLKIPRKEDLRQDATQVARTLAGYGWTTVVVTPSPEAGLPPRSARIGKWILSNRGIWYQERKKPERARAYLELAEVLLEQNALLDAEEAFRKALLHFADDPATADAQSRTLAGLAEVHRRSGDLRRAREALAVAAELDPSRAGALDSVAAALRDRHAPLRKLVDLTAGHMVLGENELREALVDLSRRLQVTVQLAGRPRGALVPVEVIDRRGKPTRFSPWIRSGTPPRTVEARLRRTVAGESLDGDLAVTLSTEGDDPPQVRASFPLLERPRLSSMEIGPDATPSFSHREPSASAQTATIDASKHPNGVPDWIAIHVEDLETGVWGVATLEVVAPTRGVADHNPGG